MTVEIKHEPASQRRHFRMTFPINVTFGDVEFQSVDWSLSGIRIGGFGSDLKKGEVLEAKVSIPFSGYEFSFNTKLNVIHCDVDKGILSTEFIDLKEGEEEVLKTFVNSILSGEMQSVDGILRRVDIPVTPASLKPTVKDAKAEAEANKKRELGMNLYMGAGALITIVFIIVLYTNIFQMKVDSSVVTAPTDTIISTAVGDVVYIAPIAPAIIKAGEPIIKMVDPRLERDIKLASLRVQQAASEVSRTEAAFGNEEKRLDAAKGIVSNEWESSRAKVRSLENNLNLKQAAIQRGEGLIKSGFISQDRLDRLQGEYLEIEKQYNEAKQEEAKLAQTLSSVNKGFHVRDKMVEGGLGDIDELKKSAIERQAIAEAELAFLEEQRERLVIKAPTEGKLVRAFVNVNTSVRYGEPIAMFEKVGDKSVQAFLTQEEALEVQIGDTVDVNFPDIWLSVPHKIKDIDYYTLAANQNLGRFVWQDSKARSVIVTLEPVDAKAHAKINNIAPGTAASAIFNTLF